MKYYNTWLRNKLTSILISDVTCVCTLCYRQCSQTNSKYTIGDTVNNEVD